MHFVDDRTLADARPGNEEERPHGGKALSHPCVPHALAWCALRCRLRGLQRALIGCRCGRGLAGGRGALIVQDFVHDDDHVSGARIARVVIARRQDPAGDRRCPCDTRVDPVADRARPVGATGDVEARDRPLKPASMLATSDGSRMVSRRTVCAADVLTIPWSEVITR